MMGLEAWKDLWKFVFFGASLVFYLVVVVVGWKGMGDVKAMLKTMLAERARRD